MSRPTAGCNSQTTPDEVLAQRPVVSRGAARRCLILAYFAVAALVPTVGLAALLAANPPGRIASFDDDAYYYFRIAHNIVTGAGSTYDGFGRTNGYHPLWMLLLLPIFRFVHSPLGALPVVYLLASLFWVASFAAMYAIGRRLHRPIAIAVAMLPLAAFGSRFSGPGGVFLGGMEVVVTLLCVLLLLRMCLSSGYLTSAGPSRTAALAMGVVLAVTFLSRLDSVFFIAAFLLVAWARWRRQSRQKLALLCWTALPVALAVLGYVALNRWYFGTAMPVSGQAKSLGAPTLNVQPLLVLLQFGDALGHHVYLGIVTGMATAAALILWLRRRSSARSESTDTVGYFLVAATIGLAALFAYLVVFTTYQAWSWYFYLLPINLTLAVFLLLDLGLESRLDRAGTPVVAAVAVVAVALPLLTGGLQYRQLRHETTNSTWVDHAVAVADWLNKNTPSGSVMAMGDSAGAIGYLLHQPLVQLEGLVGAPDYVQSLSAGTAPNFLRAKKVNYLIMTRPTADFPTQDGCPRYVEPVQGRGPKMSLTLCAADVVYSHLLDDGRRYVVWKYRSELNP